MSATSAADTHRIDAHQATLGSTESHRNGRPVLAVIAPTLTPALNISVVAGLAGIGCWLSFLIGTIGVVIVAGERRHARGAPSRRPDPISSTSGAPSGRSPAHSPAGR
jgi:hypothetical protein